MPTCRFVANALLSTANSDDDFELVTIAQALSRELAARHDLAIAFQSNAFVAE